MWKERPFAIDTKDKGRSTNKHQLHFDIHFTRGGSAVVYNIVNRAQSIKRTHIIGAKIGASFSDRIFIGLIKVET